MLHAEGAKRKLSHEDLRDVVGVASLAEATPETLERCLRRWGLRLPRRRALPRRAYAKQAAAAGTAELISGEDLELLGRAFAARGWTADTAKTFIRRQLGRERILTRADFHKVFSGVRAMNRRDGIGQAEKGAQNV